MDTIDVCSYYVDVHRGGWHTDYVNVTVLQIEIGQVTIRTKNGGIVIIQGPFEISVKGLMKRRNNLRGGIKWNSENQALINIWM